MRTRTIALLAAAALLAGCAGEAEDATGPGATTGPSQPGDPVTPPGDDDTEDGSDATTAAAELTVEVDPGDGGAPTTWTLGCDPPSGDHPDAGAACAAIAEAGGAAAFAPVPGDAMCTQIYGGPQVARVTGTLDGSPVSAEFSRENGCEMSRWDSLAPLLGAVTGTGTVTE